MYNVVIAEDESIIRNGLSRLINWQVYDCEVKYLAEDGMRALAYIRDNPVDILITDIKMPHMDGLELIKHVKEINEDIVTFIISGYGEFEYAKTAIKYNVNGYILKPLEEEQLCELILKAVSILRKRAQQRATEQYARIILLKNLIMAREKLFSRVFSSHTEIDKIEENPDLFESLGLDDNMFYGVYLFDVPKEILEELKEQLAYSSDHIVLMEIQSDLWSLVAFGTNENEIRNHIETLKSMLSKNGYRKSIQGAGNGKIYQGLRGLRHSFEEAVTSFNLKQSNIIMLQNREGKAAGINIKEKCDKIVNFVIQKREGLSAYLDLVEEELLLTGVQCLENTNILLGGVYARIVNTYFSRKEHVDAGILLKLYSFYERAINAIEINRKIRILEELLTESSSLFEVSPKGKWAKEINMAIDYIKENYYKRTLDVGEIADYVGMNPRYFSMVFKDETGKSVMKYLIEYRINIAKQLIMDKDLKAYQVAEMVGYDSYPYFSTLFRKMTGENPVTYSKKIWAMNTDTHP